MTKPIANTTTFYAEGVDWKETVSVDADIFVSDPDQLFEAATSAIEINIEKYGNKFKLGPMVQIKEKTGKKRTALVNSYICLNNAAKYALADRLCSAFKKAEGQDLSVDDTGFSWVK